MNVMTALSEVARMAAALGALAESISAASALVAKIQAEGRKDLTPEEWAQVKGWDDDARARLVRVISEVE